jgi:hypothetical protein
MREVECGIWLVSSDLICYQARGGSLRERQGTHPELIQPQEGI